MQNPLNRDIYHFKNISGETMPSFALGELTGLLVESGITRRMPNGAPVFRLDKVQDPNGIIVVNLGSSVDVAGFSSGIILSMATVVSTGTSTVSFGDDIGPEEGKWEATTTGTGLHVLDSTYQGRAPVTWAGAATTTTTSGSGSCPCQCISVGSVNVSGQSAAGEWYVNLLTATKKVQGGTIYLPANIYFMGLNGTSWGLDITPQLRAKTTAGVDVTASSNMSGSLIFIPDDGGYTKLILDFDGTLP